MRDDAFRAYLAPALTRAAVSDYVSRVRRVQRTCGIDLDAADLSTSSIGILRGKLAEAGLDRSAISSCISAVRSYAAFRDRGEPPSTGQPVISITASAAHEAAAADRTGAASGQLALRSVPELMKMYAAILGELRCRNVTRTGNGPVGDYAEMLFASTFGWRLTENSHSGHDAVDASGRRYQIKGRRLHSATASRQLGSIRRLPDRPFDDLAVLMFDGDMAVLRAAIVPIEMVERTARYVAHTNSWRMMMPDSVWSSGGVRDVTDAIQATVQSTIVNG